MAQSTKLLTAVNEANNITSEKIAAYTAAYFDFVLADSSGGSFTITLPTASGYKGVPIKVKAINSGPTTNPITIDTTGGETIDGAASRQITAAFGELEFISDGDEWFITNLDGTTSSLVKDLRQSITADVTVGNTIAETALATFNIGANQLVVGDIVTVRGMGRFGNDSVAAADFILRLRLGGIAGPKIFNTGDVGLTVQAGLVDGEFTFEQRFTVRSIGATGSILSNVGKLEAETQFSICTPLQEGFILPTIDTTAAQDLVLSIQHSVAAADIITVLRDLTVHWESV
jgi:hypothetical protein